MKVMTVRVPTELNEALSRVAQQEDLSKNYIVKKAVREFLERHSDVKSQDEKQKAKSA